MHEADHGNAKQRVLAVAEQLFIQRGYAAITLRDIANALGMRQASLYYHFPEGKEQLFVAMATRVFERHQKGMQQAIAKAGDDLFDQLQAVAAWFGSQPPLNLLGMMHADMPVLNPAHTAQLTQVVHQAMFIPLRQMFMAATVRGAIRTVHPDLLAGCFLSLMDGLRYGESRPGAPPRQVMVDEIIRLLLDGLRPRV
jgi:AcrR family transcriptional regulator